MNKSKKVNLEEINEILSETLINIIEKKISLAQAKAISQTAIALSKNIANTDLKNRIEILEQALKRR